MVLNEKKKDLNYTNEDFTFPNYYSKTDDKGRITYRSPMSHKWITKIPNSHNINCNSKSRCVVFNIIWHAKSLLPNVEFSMTKFRSYITEACLEMTPALKVSTVKSLLSTTIASLNRLNFIDYDGKSSAVVNNMLVSRKITDILDDVVKDLAGDYVPTGTRSEYSPPKYSSDKTSSTPTDIEEVEKIEEDEKIDTSLNLLLDISKGELVFYVAKEGVIRMVDYPCSVSVAEGIISITTKFRVINLSDIDIVLEDAIKRAGMTL